MDGVKFGFNDVISLYKSLVLSVQAFYPTNTILLTFIGRKFKIDHVRKQLETSQNILDILWCIANARINVQRKFHVFTVIFFLT